MFWWNVAKLEQEQNISGDIPIWCGQDISKTECDCDVLIRCGQIRTWTEYLELGGQDTIQQEM